MADPLETGGRQFGVDSNTQMMTAVSLRQQVGSFAAVTAVTLKNPSSITNDSAVAGYIAFLVDDEAAYLREYFQAGQEKMRRVRSVGGTAQGTGAGITLVTVHES